MGPELLLGYLYVAFVGLAFIVAVLIVLGVIYAIKTDIDERNKKRDIRAELAQSLDDLKAGLGRKFTVDVPEVKKKRKRKKE